MFKRFFLAISVLLIAHFIQKKVDCRKNELSRGNHVCSRKITYEEKRIVPYTELVQKTKQTFCWNISRLFRCNKYTFEKVHRNKTLVVNVTKTVLDCCRGYEKIDNTCVPICYHGCTNGECIDPDKCLCFEGWKGPTCDQKCAPNEYGRNCKHSCYCLNDATCNREDGSCQCKEGYIGDQCEFPCPNRTYGPHCKHECQCQNGAFCDIRDGSCDCQPGYYGDHCEKPCEAGTHGEGCQHACICFNDTTELCNHVDGKCICKAGYTGDYCEAKCPNFTFGKGCESHCDCANSDFCDPVTGDCSCKPGWRGSKCEEKCPEGSFGDGCRLTCEACGDRDNTTGFCLHESGACVCPPGTKGERCEKACDEGFWGLNCSEKCDCLNDGNCVPETGQCECLPGWTGPNCSEGCAEGTYGLHCSGLCQCGNGTSCDPETGICSGAVHNSSGSPMNTSDGFDRGSKSSYKWTIFYFVLSGFVVLTLVSILAVFVWIAYRKQWFRRNIGCPNGGKSTETFVNPTFNNPTYDVSGGIVQIDPHVEYRLTAPGNEDSKNNIENILDMLRNIKPKRLSHSSNNDAGKEKRASGHGSSKRSSKSTRASSASNQSSNCESWYAVYGDVEEHYEPETLDYFNILDDIYENIREGNDLEESAKENFEPSNKPENGMKT